jgi:hypothetical protein
MCLEGIQTRSGKPNLLCSSKVMSLAVEKRHGGMTQKDGREGLKLERRKREMKYRKKNINMKNQCNLLENNAALF